MSEPADVADKGRVRASNASAPRSRGAHWAWWALLAVGVLLVIAGALPVWLGLRPGAADARSSHSAAAVNLLASASIDTHDVRGASRLTDARVAAAGDDWKTDLTAQFRGRHARVDYDLGQPRGVRAAYLQADNNDRYVISGSNDGQRYTVVWRAPSVRRTGLQSRFTDDIEGSYRYIRVQARGGDGRYALSEVALYAARPAVFPPAFEAARGVPVSDGLAVRLLLFAAAFALWLGLSSARAPAWRNGSVGIVVVIAAVFAGQGLLDAWPVEQSEVALVRAVAAAMALLAVLRWVVLPKRFPAERGSVVATLAVSGMLAVAAFYNLGHPQFWNHEAKAPRFIHDHDMRVYYPVAKYFDELGYRGVYLASVAAYAENAGKPLTSLGSVQFRDLRTHALTSVAASQAEIAEVRGRFSDERWQAFKKDMGYFTGTMGPQGYLGSMHDHGGNATPVWFSLTHLLFAKTTANDATLLIGALLDPLLLALMFFAIARTFGLRTMLVCLVVFGANDFYMFGSNWAGATLRHDWMAYLGLGFCALHTRRFALGGALLALAALIRAFPALALVAIAFPSLWWFLAEFVRTKRLPRLSRVWRTRQPVLRAYAGALAAVVVLGLLSIAVTSPGAWHDWLDKVKLLNGQEHVNHVSLKTIFVELGHPKGAERMQRLVGFGAVATIFIAAVVVACRRRTLVQAGVLGLFLVPVVFYPANYYLHLVFLLPLLVHERRGGRAPSEEVTLSPSDAVLWIALLGLCAAQYWTTLEKSYAIHFLQASLILFSCLVLILGVFLGRDVVGWWRRGRAPAVMATGSATGDTNGGTVRWPKRLEAT